MTTETKSRIMLTALIAAGMLPGCYLLTLRAYLPYGLMLIVGGLGVLLWVWKPWHWFRAGADDH